MTSDSKNIPETPIISTAENAAAATPHVRRKRYAGSHPRQFADKYKELNADDFAADVQKVIARGQTPASTHRPICVDEILAILKPAPGEIALDVTLGFGGHTQAILPRLLPGGHLVGTDVDSVERPRTEARLRALGYGADVLTVREMNFADIATLLADAPKNAPQGFDCILADFGVSSMQLDNPERGFSYKNDGPLDLRLNPAKGAPASYLLQKMTAYELTQLFTDVADEPHAALRPPLGRIEEWLDAQALHHPVEALIVRRIQGASVDEVLAGRHGPRGDLLRKEGRQRISVEGVRRQDGADREGPRRPLDEPQAGRA